MMNNLLFACITPHGWSLIPFIGGTDSLKAHSSQLAMQEIGRKTAEFHSETLAVMTPHGLIVEGIFSLLDTQIVRGSTGGESHLSATPHSFTLEFQVDRDFNAALVNAARQNNLPAARVKNDLPWVPLSLDFAAAIPLWFTGASLFPPPKVVILCAGQDLDWHLFPVFGKAIRQAAVETNRRIGFIASADMGHAHDPKHEYGYDPASSEYEQAVIAAVRENDLGRLLEFDPEWVKRAKTDSYGPLLALSGLLEGSELKSELLSYETPTYFGMLAALWT